MHIYIYINAYIYIHFVYYIPGIYIAIYVSGSSKIQILFPLNISGFIEILSCDLWKNFSFSFI